jgi:hypothetical protein
MAVKGILTMNRRLPAIFACLLVLLLTAVLTACGGDDEEDAPPKAAATSAATQAATAAAKATSAASGGGGGGGAGGGAVFAAMCSEWRNVQAQTTAFSGPPTGATMPQPADFRTSMEALDRNLKTFVAQAPTEIRPDFQVLADFWSKYAGIMARANYDFMQLAQDPEFQQLAGDSASDARLQQATTNIQNWVQRNCT